jgi:uncharacterized protein YndB with AHSA1/START domain
MKHDQGEQDSVVAEITIAAPPERVFQAITDPKQLMQWFTDGACPAKHWELDVRKGGRWRFGTSASPKPLNGVSEFRAGGEILELDPPRLLVYTWHANWHDDPAQATVVRWELATSKDGTVVKVTHSGLGKETLAHKDYTAGWPDVLNNLKTFSQ